MYMLVHNVNRVMRYNHVQYTALKIHHMDERRLEIFQAVKKQYIRNTVC